MMRRVNIFSPHARLRSKKNITGVLLGAPTHSKNSAASWGRIPRVCRSGQVCIRGCGYFGLQGHPELIEAACQAVRKYGLGSATSRLGYGNNQLLLAVEKNAAKFFETESALYYSSGYMGNSILLQGFKPSWARASPWKGSFR